MMKKILPIVAYFIFFAQLTVYSQIGFDNDSPDPSAVLDLTATDKGLLIPRMTTQQREAIASPANSLLVFDTDVNNYFYFISNRWVSLNQWSSSASNDDVYLESGNVGIGTTTPDYSLDVNGPINTSALNINGSSFSAADLHPVSNGLAAITATGDWNDYGNTGFYMGHNLTNQPPTISGMHPWKYVTVIRHNAEYCVQYATDFNNHASWTRVKNSGSWGEWKITLQIQNEYITNQNRLGARIVSVRHIDNTRWGYIEFKRLDDVRGAYIGWGNGGNRLEMSLDAASEFYINKDLIVNGTFRNPSDIRLKDNITPIENALDKVLQIEGVTYTRKDYEALEIDKEKRHLGVVADQLLKVVPELVQVPEDAEHYKSVNYSGLTVVLIEAMKEQQVQIEALKSEIEKLKAGNK